MRPAYLRMTGEFDELYDDDETLDPSVLTAEQTAQVKDAVRKASALELQCATSENRRQRQNGLQKAMSNLVM